MLPATIVKKKKKLQKIETFYLLKFYLIGNALSLNDFMLESDRIRFAKEFVDALRIYDQERETKCPEVKE